MSSINNNELEAINENEQLKDNGWDKDIDIDIDNVDMQFDDSNTKKQIIDAQIDAFDTGPALINYYKFDNIDY